MTIVEAARGVTGGVDTHLDVHVPWHSTPWEPCWALSPLPNAGGYKELLGWLESFGAVAKVGVEGTGSYGATWPVFSVEAGLK